GYPAGLGRLASGRVPGGGFREAGSPLRRLSRPPRPAARPVDGRLGRTGRAVARGAPRPLIAITGPRRGAAMPRLCVALAVWLAGGRPRQLSPADPVSMQRFHGVVVTGGHDVDPVLYAQESQVLPHYDPERDRFESAIIDDALARGLPLLGICRGAQLLNVRLGGDLHQDLRR